LQSLLLTYPFQNGSILSSSTFRLILGIKVIAISPHCPLVILVIAMHVWRKVIPSTGCSCCCIILPYELFNRWKVRKSTTCVNHVVRCKITYFQQLYFISSALNFYFVYDFCLYENLSPVVSYFLRLLPFLEALLLLPPVAIFRWVCEVLSFQWLDGMLSCCGHREKKMMMLKHHGIWWIVLLLYAHLIHTSISILNCPSLTMANRSVSYNKPNG
jgi:hypothetical protein